jgi:hypothetical protein
MKFGLTATVTLATLVFCTASATAGPAEDCAHPRTAATVQHLLYSNYLPPSYRAKVSEQLFRDGTIVKMASPIDHNRDLKLTTCEATFAVDASYGLDRDTDRALQYMFARDTDSIVALVANGMEKVGEKAKLFGFRIQYTVQPVPGDTMVRAAPVNVLQMSLVGGFLIAIPQSVR